MPVVDLQYINDACGDDAQMRAEIVELFIDQMRGVGPELDKLFVADDLDTLARTAHKIKSTALSMGMNDMADALKKIEIVGKKLLLSEGKVNEESSLFALYNNQIHSLPPEIDEWTSQNMSKKSLRTLIDFCKLQSLSAIDEVSAL